MHNLFHLDQILGPTICIHDQMPLKSCASKAGIAQLVERNLAKVEVASSNLVSRSIFFLMIANKRVQCGALKR